MRTHRDIVQRAAFGTGLKRAGQDLGGPVYEELLNALEDMLVEIDEDHALDFDPIDDAAVPEERAGPLVQLFLMSPVFDQFDQRRSSAEREVLFERRRKRFIASVVGESDFVGDEVHNF